LVKRKSFALLFCHTSYVSVMLVDPQVGYITVILQFLQAVSNLGIRHLSGKGWW
jgi:hypothetical protein